MDIITPGSWNELNHVLYEGSWQPDMHRFRATCALRGMSCISYCLDTSLRRLNGDARELEVHLLRAFQRYAYGSHDHVGTEWGWLALAQHHGLPTRLLDWTYSPLVALHFATESEEHYGEDGVIWSVDFEATNRLLPRALKDVLDRNGSYVLSEAMLTEVTPALHDFDALGNEPYVAWYEPPSLDARIVNQYALFSLMSDPSLSLGKWLDQRPEMARCIVVRSDLKMEVRDKLDQANITERVLFPGLDGLSRWLKRYYTPRLSGGVTETGPETEARPADASTRRRVG